MQMASNVHKCSINQALGEGDTKAKLGLSQSTQCNMQDTSDYTKL